MNSLEQLQSVIKEKNPNQGILPLIRPIFSKESIEEYVRYSDKTGSYNILDFTPTEINLEDISNDCIVKTVLLKDLPDSTLLKLKEGIEEDVFKISKYRL